MTVRACPSWKSYSILSYPILVYAVLPLLVYPVLPLLVYPVLPLLVYPLAAVPKHSDTRDWFHGRQFYHRPGRGMVWGDSRELHLWCTLFLLLPQLHLGSSGIRSRRLGTPALLRHQEAEADCLCPFAASSPVEGARPSLLAFTRLLSWIASCSLGQPHASHVPPAAGSRMQHVHLGFAHGLPFTVHSHQLLLLQNSGQASLLWGSPLTAPARVRGPSSGRRSHTGRLMRYWVVWFNSCCLPPPLVEGPFGQ